jgi:hypothetical protein
MLTRGKAYVEHGMAAYEEQSRQRKMRHLRRCAHQLGSRLWLEKQKQIKSLRWLT